MRRRRWPRPERSLSLIDKATARQAADRLGFIRMLILHYLVGNAGAHGKNYALLYLGKTPDLAPLYDVVCTAAYPRLAKKLAIAIGGRSIPDAIRLQHWLTLGPSSRSAQRLLMVIFGALPNAFEVKPTRLLKSWRRRGSRTPFSRRYAPSLRDGPLICCELPRMPKTEPG